MLKAYRFTRQIPACVTVDAIGRVDPSVNGSSAPSARATNRSTIAVGRIRSPALTRRRNADAPEECWHVVYGDVHVGKIAIRAGIPHDEDPWGWSCGFYPGCKPGEHTNGSAETFEQARADFEQAWRVILSKRTEADFQAWRDQRAG